MGSVLYPHCWKLAFLNPLKWSFTKWGSFYHIQESSLNCSLCVGIICLIWSTVGTAHRLCIISNRSGKACVLVSVPTLLAWEGTDTASYSGPAVGSVDSYTFWKDYLDVSDEGKEPTTWQIILSLGVPVTHWQEPATGHSWGWNEINHLLSEKSSLAFL